MKECPYCKSDLREVVANGGNIDLYCNNRDCGYYTAKPWREPRYTQEEIEQMSEGGEVL